MGNSGEDMGNVKFKGIRCEAIFRELGKIGILGRVEILDSEVLATEITGYHVDNQVKLIKTRFRGKERPYQRVEGSEIEYRQKESLIMKWVGSFTGNVDKKYVNKKEIERHLPGYCQ